MNAIILHLADFGDYFFRDSSRTSTPETLSVSTSFPGPFPWPGGIHVTSPHLQKVNMPTLLPANLTPEIPAVTHDRQHLRCNLGVHEHQNEHMAG